MRSNPTHMSRRRPSVMGWPSTVEPPHGPQSILWNCGGSYRGLHEITHSHRVVDGRCECEQPADPLQAKEFHFARQPDRLQPPKDLFDPFAPLQTHGIARVTRRVVARAPQQSDRRFPFRRVPVAEVRRVFATSPCRFSIRICSAKHSLAFPQFRGHPVKSQSISLRTRSRSGSRVWSADVAN